MIYTALKNALEQWNIKSQLKDIYMCSGANKNSDWQPYAKKYTFLSGIF